MKKTLTSLLLVLLITLMTFGSVVAQKDKINLKGEVISLEGDVLTVDAYCVDGKKETNHPLAAKIAERYGIDEETVMTYYCQGYSIGEIMLALKTSQMEGVEATLEDILGSLDGPDAWGHIWQDMGLIGWEKNGTPPPGQLKKLDTTGDD